MSKTSKRNAVIDILKGIAVISVLLGHAIQRGLGMNGYVPFDNYLFKLIYTYHMPLFMVLSGYALAQYTKKYDFKFLFKKTRRLLFPTIIWSYLIWSIRKFDFVGIKEFISFPESILEYTKTLFFHPDYVIWFLYVVFVFSAFFFIQKQINKKSDIYIDLLISALFYLILKLLPADYFGIYNLQTYFPIFAFGYYLNKDYLKKLPWKYMIICLIVYLLLFIKYADSFIVNRPVYYMISFAAIYIIYQIVLRIKDYKICNILQFLGKYSLEIYLCQCLCLNIGLGSGYFRVLTIFVTATTISVLLSVLTNKIAPLKLFLYGKLKKE